jgi:hypothetical protein
MTRSRLAVLLALVVSASGARAGEGTDAPYGFSGVEIYKVHGGAFGLEAADVDRDGVNDLVVVHNAKARIDVFLRRPKGVAPPAGSSEDRANDLRDDLFFDREQILTEKEVTSMAISDLDGDAMLDVAYVGKPPELVVAYGDGKGAFPRTRRFPVSAPTEVRSGLAAGDLDGNGRTDLALLAEKHVWLFLQGTDGVLKDPVRLPHSIQDPGGLDVRDVEGDGRADLVLHAPSDPRPLRMRLQQDDGSLGPERSFELAPYRQLHLVDFLPGGGAEIMAVQRSSGLLRLLSLAPKEGAAEKGTFSLGDLLLFPFETDASGKSRSVAVGDVNGDGRLDLVVTEPASAQVAVHLQTANGRIGPRRVFPSLSEVEQVVARDFDGDRKAEVVVLSSREKSVGVASLDPEGRLPFPRAVTLDGTPQALGTGDLGGDGGVDLVVLVKRAEGYVLAELAASAAGVDVKRTVEVAGLDPKKDEPSEILLADIDQDGRTDVLLFDRYKPVRALVQKKDGSFEDASRSPDYGGGLVEKKRLADAALVDVDADGKPELLVASQNFARALVLQDGRLVVKDQVNARGASSRVKGMAAADLDGDGTSEVAFLDEEANSLTVLRKDASGVYQVAANAPLGTLTFDRLLAHDVDGDGAPDLLAVGRDQFGVFRSRGVEEELRPAHAYESVAKDAWLLDFGLGDLNADGRLDVAVVDAREHALEILSYDAKDGFKRRLRWKAFERKLHEDRRSGSEPREILVKELTGDGLDDVALLVHDRLLVYPQDAKRAP